MPESMAPLPAHLRHCVGGGGRGRGASASLCCCVVFRQVGVDPKLPTSPSLPSPRLRQLLVAPTQWADLCPRGTAVPWRAPHQALQNLSLTFGLLLLSLFQGSEFRMDAGLCPTGLCGLCFACELWTCVSDGRLNVSTCSSASISNFQCPN